VDDLERFPEVLSGSLKQLKQAKSSSSPLEKLGICFKVENLFHSIHTCVLRCGRASATLAASAMEVCTDHRSQIVDSGGFTSTCPF
jgi:hypothetical protein